MYPQPLPPDNRLLAALPQADWITLARFLRAEQLTSRNVLWRVRDTVSMIYFPTTGMLSALVALEEGDFIEGLFAGREGAIGLDALFGGGISAWTITVQLSGAALTIARADLERLLPELPATQRLFFRYTSAQQHIATQSIACNRFHEVQERLARWLLVLHDRAEGGPIRVSHEFLGQMLGAHRPTVSLALAATSRAGLISTSRNQIEVLDRMGLEQSSCECYRRIVEYTERVFTDVT